MLNDLTLQKALMHLVFPMRLMDETTVQVAAEPIANPLTWN